MTNQHLQIHTPQSPARVPQTPKWTSISFPAHFPDCFLTSLESPKSLVMLRGKVAFSYFDYSRLQKKTWRAQTGLSFSDHTWSDIGAKEKRFGPKENSGCGRLKVEQMNTCILWTVRKSECLPVIGKFWVQVTFLFARTSSSPCWKPQVTTAPSDFFCGFQLYCLNQVWKWT